MEIAVVRWFAACALCRATSRALHKTGDYIYQRFANLQQSNKMITLFDVTIGRTHAVFFFFVRRVSEGVSAWICIAHNR